MGTHLMWTDRQTDTTENITVLQLRWQAEITGGSLISL